MRRSVLVRFLALSLAVALGAVIATALIATYSTSEKLQGEIDANTGQLQVDGEIYGELAKYAADHPTWSGVDTVVRDLADRLGRRVAVTTADGAVIADSARKLGAAPDLPSVPAATIDARANGLPKPAGAIAVYSASAARKTVALDAPGFVATAVVGAPFLAYPDWGMTADEIKARDRLARQAVDCYAAKGMTASVARSTGRAPQLLIASKQTVSGVQVQSSTKPTDTCTPPGLNAPSAKARVVNDDEVRRSTECLRAAAVAFKVNEYEGLKVVEPTSPESADEKFANCVTQARVQALTPYVAPPAKLYLGAKSTFTVFSGEGLLRTAATALGVLLIAALVMFFAGRRLVRPIVALTGAAQRMRNGDHAARVPVSGKDEVARLGHAFNDMAESIERHDFQRKALVSDVAHELRTPLANIKGYLVASEDGVVPLDQSLVSSLLEETGLLEHLVADLQDLALADAGMLRLHPASRDLTELAQQVVSAHRPAAEAAGVTLRTTAAGPSRAFVDSARIRQALGNLVSNAIRYTPSGGRVEVGVRAVDDGYNLTVTDTGSGIAAEHLPHIFDRFYRADVSRTRTTGGSGLGLAITKHLVEAHRGRITVTSRPNSGSTFTIWLPA